MKQHLLPYGHDPETQNVCKDKGMIKKKTEGVMEDESAYPANFGLVLI